MYDCGDLVGRPYRLGADGSGKEIDCIHLCYVALERMGIKAPAFKQSWYTDSKVVNLPRLDVVGFSRKNS